MGFNVRKVYRLVFADPDYDGFEVRAHSVSVDTFLRITQLANDSKDDDPGHLELFALVGAALVSWNAEDDDGPIPATAEGFRRLDIDLAFTLIRTWMDAIGGVVGPLGTTSSAGAPSEEASIPMETLLSSSLSN